MKRTMVGLLGLCFGVMVLGLAAIRFGFILGPEFSREACVAKEAEFTSALSRTLIRHRDLPQFDQQVNGLDRVDRSESVAACEVADSNNHRSPHMTQLTVERYANGAAAEGVFAAQRPGDWLEPYDGVRPYRDRRSGDDVSVPVSPGTASQFESLHLFDCVIVLALWKRPLEDENLASSAQRDAWVRQRMTDFADEICLGI